MHRPLFLVIVFGCAAGESPLAVECGTTSVSEPRLVWGTGIDGVRMGDTEEAVRKKLGGPEDPYFVDWYGTSHGFLWDEGVHAGVRVMFVWRPDTTVDVGWVEAVWPYAARTADGIGLGSSRSEVECVYGPSERESAPDNWYAHMGLLHWGQFDADTVAAIWLMDESFFGNP